MAKSEIEVRLKDLIDCEARWVCVDDVICLRQFGSITMNQTYVTATVTKKTSNSTGTIIFLYTDINVIVMSRFDVLIWMKRR